MTTDQITDTKKLTKKIAKEFNLSLSTRYLCPSPTHNSNSPSYSLASNYCFSCKHKANDIVSLIRGLMDSNPRVFRNQDEVLDNEQIRSRLQSAGIPNEFVPRKTSEQIANEKKKVSSAIHNFLASNKDKLKGNHNKFDIDQAEYEDLIAKMGLPADKFEVESFPVSVYYQLSKKIHTISVPEAGLTMGPNFMRGNFNPSEIVITKSVEKVVDNKPAADQFVFATTNTWLPNIIKRALVSGKAKNVIVDDVKGFKTILGFVAKEGLALPNIEIENPKTTIESIPAKQMSMLFKPTEIKPPEGVNYLNINKPKEFDNVVNIGGEYLEMADGIDAETRSLIKTSAVDLIDFFTGKRRAVGSNFESDGSMVAYALETLQAVNPKTENIEKEITLLQNMSPEQKKSFDVQLKVAKAIKEMFPDEFWGVKGSANNLNILYLMGITSVNPANIKAMTPFSFLMPGTNKNPDFDFELSGSQIDKFLTKYPEFIKGLTETSLGDRVHVCKYFLNLPDEYKVYKTGEYIPVNSMEIEKTTATPIDLIVSNVVERLNGMSGDTDVNAQVPMDYKVSRQSLKEDELPHFNDTVLKNIEGNKRVPDELDVQEMANVCATNRPVFYRSKVVLKDNQGRKYPFSVSTKKGYESFTPLSYEAANLLHDGSITEDDIVNFGYSTKNVGALSVDYYHSKYMAKLPQWVTKQNEEILEETDGTILYQEQLMMLLNKYSPLKTSEIVDIIKKIAHPSKVVSEEDGSETFVPADYIDVDLDPNIPEGIAEQIIFILNSPEAFFFKMGHALFVAETARKLSYFESEAKGRGSLRRDEEEDMSYTMRAADQAIRTRTPSYSM